MFELYWAIGLVISCVSLIMALISVAYNNDVNAAEPTYKYWQWAAMILTLGLGIAWLWPVLVALAIPVAVVYGLWCWARAIKHRTIDF